LPSAKEKDYVHVYTDKLDTYSGAGGGSGTVSKFLRFVGNRRIKTIIIDKTESGSDELSWRNHYSSDLSRLEQYKQLHNEKVDTLLNNLSRQMGLTFERKTAPVEKWFIAEQESSAESIPVPVLAKSPAPSAEDTPFVAVECLIVEVSLDSKMDRETVNEAENLLGNKVSFRNSALSGYTRAAEVLLRKAAEATAAIKDKSAENKRVTQDQFTALVEMLSSKGYLKILMNPKVQVVDGQRAVIKTNHDSLRIAPRILPEDGDIILQVEAVLSSQSTYQSKDQKPITKRELSTRARISPGESMIIGGIKMTEKSTEADSNVKDTEEQATEVLFILTPTIITSTPKPQKKTEVWDKGTRSKDTASQQLSFGTAVEGVQCRLQADKRIWQAGEVPTFKADVRNGGERHLQLPESPDYCLVQIDGRWFFITRLSTRVLDFLPGQQRTGIPLELSDKWETMLDSEVALGAYVRHDGIMTGPGLRSRLKLTPGKHTIRVSFIVTATRRGSGLHPIPPVQVVSNPVEIEILPAEKTNVRIESKEAMVHRVYDISDLVETAADADSLIRRITGTIEPDGWYGLSETGEGTITAYPLRQPKKFAVMQTYEIHQQIEHFLEDIRSSRDELPEPNLPLAPEVPLITNTFIDADLLEVLQDIASMTGIPIIPDETVVGLVTAELQDVPLETALDIVLAGTPYVVKKTPYYYLVASAVELPEITTRIESAKKLSNLGKALFIYANDNDDKYPDSMHEMRGYLKTEDFAWTWQNVEYLAKGKTLAVRPDTVIAYDKKLLAERKGTNVLFNDSHVEFVKPERLKELGISATEILIETRILSVSEDFLKDIGLDANSVYNSDVWSEHLVEESATWPNSETYSLILDDLTVSFLLKAAQAHEGAKMLAAPRVTVLEGKEARIALQRAIHYISGYAEPNRPSDEPEPKHDSSIKGIELQLTPNLTPDDKNILLDVDFKLSEVIGFEERKYKGKYPYSIPQTEVVSTKTRRLVPDGKTLLIGGLKITAEVKNQAGVPILSKLPLIGKAFRSRSTIKDHKILLILLKTGILSPEQAEEMGLHKPGPEQLKAPALGGYGGYGYGAPPGPAGVSVYGRYDPNRPAEPK